MRLQELLSQISNGASQIILIIIGIVIVALLLSRKGREKVLRPAQDKIVGICATALDQTVRKNTNKEKALEFLRARRSLGEGGVAHSEASNEEIREHLGVSRRSVVRYLDELVPKPSPKFYVLSLYSQKHAI